MAAARRGSLAYGAAAVFGITCFVANWSGFWGIGCHDRGGSDRGGTILGIQELQRQYAGAEPRFEKFD